MAARAVASTASFNVSPVRKSTANRRGAVSPGRAPNYSPSKTGKTKTRDQVKSQLSVKTNAVQNVARDTNFIKVLFVLVGITLLIMLIMNVLISSMAINSGDTQRQIDKLNQDSQRVRVQLEEKGTAIPERATQLGMVPRSQTTLLNLNKDQVPKPLVPTAKGSANAQ